MKTPYSGILMLPAFSGTVWDGSSEGDYLGYKRGLGMSIFPENSINIKEESLLFL